MSGSEGSANATLNSLPKNRTGTAAQRRPSSGDISARQDAIDPERGEVDVGDRPLLRKHACKLGLEHPALADQDPSDNIAASAALNESLRELLIGDQPLPDEQLPKPRRRRSPRIGRGADDLERPARSQGLSRYCCPRLERRVGLLAPRSRSTSRGSRPHRATPRGSRPRSSHRPHWRPMRPGARSNPEAPDSCGSRSALSASRDRQRHTTCEFADQPVPQIGSHVAWCSLRSGPQTLPISGVAKPGVRPLWGDQMRGDWRRGLRLPPPQQSPARGCGLHAVLTIIGRPACVMPQVGEVK